MIWEEKTKMCQLFNAGEESKALDVVIENIHDMDEQAWDMFITGVSLIKESIEKHIEKHKKILPVIDLVESDRFRIAMRLALYCDLVSKLPSSSSNSTHTPS